MPKTKNSCPNCGDPVKADRWNAGYKYCKSKTCFEQIGRRKEVPLYDGPPKPGEVDLDPFDLEDVAEAFSED